MRPGVVLCERRVRGPCGRAAAGRAAAGRRGCEQGDSRCEQGAAGSTPRRPDLMREVIRVAIRGHQRSSEVIRGHQSGHQRSSEASTTIPARHQRPSEAIRVARCQFRTSDRAPRPPAPRPPAAASDTLSMSEAARCNPRRVVGVGARAPCCTSWTYLMRATIRGHQRSSAVISGHQRSSEVIRGH
jgi:hypothetical protein